MLLLFTLTNFYKNLEWVLSTASSLNFLGIGIDLFELDSFMGGIIDASISKMCPYYHTYTQGGTPGSEKETEFPIISERVDERAQPLKYILILTGTSCIYRHQWRYSRVEFVCIPYNVHIKGFFLKFPTKYTNSCCKNLDKKVFVAKIEIKKFFVAKIE